LMYTNDTINAFRGLLRSTSIECISLTVVLSTTAFIQCFKFTCTGFTSCGSVLLYTLTLTRVSHQFKLQYKSFANTSITIRYVFLMFVCLHKSNDSLMTRVYTQSWWSRKYNLTLHQEQIWMDYSGSVLRKNIIFLL